MNIRQKYMDATSSALIQTAVENLGYLRNLEKDYLFSPEFWTLVIPSLIALLSSIIALLVAGGIGRYIKPVLGIKSDIEFIALKRYRQADKYWRLSIRNSGKAVAKRVQVDVIGILDEGNARENFLPIPLRWTHINTENRDILPGQIVYLDVVEHKNSGLKAKLITNFGGGVDDFEVLRNGRTKITLTIYEESGRSLDKEIEINWPAGTFFDARLGGEKWHLTENGEWL